MNISVEETNDYLLRQTRTAMAFVALASHDASGLPLRASVFLKIVDACGWQFAIKGTFCCAA
jgi:hypothetical protein